MSVWAAAPSSNADRRGAYTVHSSVNEQYNYHVGVPESYDPRQGAGIHLFFHGQGKDGGVESLGSWKSICEPNHLIVINMQFLDGNNLVDTGGKVRAAMQAAEQVIADYHIILPSRGIIASFSGGGLPHALYAGQSSRTGPSAAWPFPCMALYGSNYWSSLSPTRKMCYFVGLGEKEWHMGGPTLDDTQTSRARELFNNAPRIGCDFVFRVEKGKGTASAHSTATPCPPCSTASTLRSTLSSTNPCSPTPRSARWRIAPISCNWAAHSKRSPPCWPKPISARPKNNRPNCSGRRSRPAPTTC
ncbi:MAG: hypothetical protein WC058_11560 [Phycisphaeraceae bacterium]